MDASLAQLADVASGALTERDAEDLLLDAIGFVHELRSSSGWSALAGEEVSAVALTRAIGDILKLQNANLRAYAASLYAALLSLKDSPVGTLCEPYAFAGFILCFRGLCLPTRLEMAEQQQGDDAGEQQPAVSPLALLEDVGAFLRQHSMRSSPEMFVMLLDALVDVTESSFASGGGAQKGGKRGAGGGAARAQAASSVAEAAFALLPVAMDNRHGDMLQAASVVFNRLVPAMLSVESGGKRGGHGFDRRSAALALLNSFISANAVARPLLVAVLRQLCMRVPDRADSRQHAVNSVQTLVTKCDAAEVRELCLFLYCLSKTHKINNRLIAVEVAGALLSALPAPFAKAGAYQRLMDGSCSAELDAPWSILCLGILVGRSDDKSASVRSKAITCLADCAQTFAKRLMDAPGQGAAAASMAAFVPALCACRTLKAKVIEARRARRRAEREGDDGEAGGAGEDQQAGGGGAADEDEEDAAEAAAGAAGQGGVGTLQMEQATFSATMAGKIQPDLTWITKLCHSRCRDEKAAVRKAALQLLDSVLQLGAATASASPDGGGFAGPSAQDVQILEDATVDSLVSVRKAALQTICSLVASYPDHVGLACVWARCVLPMIRDPESAVQDAVLDRLTALLLDPVAVLGARRPTGGRGGGGAAAAAESEVRQRLAALALLGRVASGCLGKALTMLTAKKLLKAQQVAAGLEAFLSAVHEPPPTAEDRPAAAGGPRRRGAAGPSEEDAADRANRRHIRDQREGAWLLLVEVAAQDPAAPSWQFLQRCWAELQSAGANASAQEGAMLLWVISHAASRFPAADASRLASGLLQAVLGFNLPCAAVAAHLAALHKLTQSEGGQAEVGPPEQWCGRVQEVAEEVLAQAMEARGNLAPSLATRCQLALFTLGEVVLLRETRLPGGALVKVQALTSMKMHGPGAGGGRNGKASSAASAVSAHAWTCLGKMCMVDESLAKKCVALLVQEMSGCPNPVVRTNLLVGLSDMVVQFTGLADAYVGRLAAMVRDPHELVRRQALALLANLLLRDYVKWRGALVHRFLLALVDESPEVRQLAQYLLSDSLAAKAPMLAYNHFLESLFVLNDCSAGLHANRSGATGGAAELAAELAMHSAVEGGVFHLKGSTAIMRAKRDIIYTALLRRMKPEQRFAASARLVADILGGVVDGLLPLEQAEEVLGDALRLLACKDIKVNVNRFGAGAEDDGNAEPSGTQEDATKARSKLVGAMVKKHLTESVIPLMVELRYLLQEKKHPLLGSLMLCMASLLRDHKSEIEDILLADKQLAREIVHDLKHYEAMSKQQQQQQEKAMAAALAGTGDRRHPAAAAAAPGPGAGRTSSAAAPSNTAAGAATSAATPAVNKLNRQQQHGGMMPPPPVPTDARRRQIGVPFGVEPGKTPIAAEVLATASKRRGPRISFANQLTPGVAAAAAAAAGGAAGPSGAANAGAKTPAPTPGAVGALFTPRTGLIGTGQQRNIAGALGIMLSPAPLSARARGPQPAQRAAGAPPGPSPAPAGLAAARARLTPGQAAAVEHAGRGSAAAETEDRFVVKLSVPDPTQPSITAGQRQGNGRRVSVEMAQEGQGGSQGGAPGRERDDAMRDQDGTSDKEAPYHRVPRTPPAVLAAAVRAAQRAAAAAVEEDGEAADGAITGGAGGSAAGGEGGGRAAGAAKMKREPDVRPGQTGPARADLGAGSGPAAPSVKAEPDDGSGAGPAAQARVVSKRRRGGA